MDLQKFNRDYSTAVKDYYIDIPDDFNFAFDIIDARAAENDGVAVIAVSRDGEAIRDIRYSDYAEDSARLANAFLSLGINKGDFGCLVIGRIPEWYTVLFACMKVGAISMPGTNLLTAKDIAYRVQKSKARFVVVTPEHCEKVDAVRGDCPTLEHFIVVGGTHPGWLSLDELMAKASPTLARKDAPPTVASDMMMAYFTSGTTSMPKMVPRDFGYALAHAATALFWMDLREGDVHWTLTDTGWAKAAWGLLFPPLLAGSKIVLYDGEGAFDPHFHLDLIKRLKVATFCAPPTVYRLFAQQDLGKYDFSSLRRSLGAGEPLNPEVIRYWQKHTGNVIADGYGQTETINIVGNFPGMETRFGSMGKPVPGFDIDIIDDDGNRQPDNEVGHIAIRTDGDSWPPGLFDGYYTGGEPDREAFRHGWYYTGDTAKRDADGYIWFEGRADDLISSGAYRISPFEVESALLEHPEVVESAVIGIPDETRGQLVKAYIILKSPEKAGPDLVTDIQDFCKNLTAPYKYPRQIEFVDSLPKTISGKIRRVELRGEG
ncbi:AMP-binding protein [uncultured Sneathiella sp.]|uniref:acyl-CoA synthetase n=1 Tax=uncultured Sneathiella sp. TaxID=879315 RepID=UPI0030DA969D